MATRRFSLIDHLIGRLDLSLRTVIGPTPISSRANPAESISDAEMTATERELAGRLLRVDHTGEICAQALYQGQALTARLSAVRDKMEQAATEENDHLAWTAGRLAELGTQKSRLNPLFYAGSFAIGALAGIAGDKWSLGFVAETERQVVRHLDSHLGRLPGPDAKSRVILEQMKEDEDRHATVAIESGGAPLPDPVKRVMKLMAKTMTATTYWI